MSNQTKPCGVTAFDINTLLKTQMSTPTYQAGEKLLDLNSLSTSKPQADIHN
ncbi:hypothetical protein DPMN_045315 [Dreissena polymorpha]|uniref:Uncharacterized protein n=1 Tax=Dreissena polymorpha TaxID=45954 RepID=A0A9D4D3Y6_DREPO|nr:hypothetical protein DPMN_045315 [Dreissena polymorpha]